MPRRTSCPSPGAGSSRRARVLTIRPSFRTRHERRLILVSEKLVHDLGAGGDHRAEFAPVDGLGGAAGAVTGKARDLLDAHPAVAHQADKGRAEFLGYPALAEPRSLGHLAEVAPDVVRVQRRAHRGGQDQPMLLPERPGVVPFPGLAPPVLAQHPDQHRPRRSRAAPRHQATTWLPTWLPTDSRSKLDEPLNW